MNIKEVLAKYNELALFDEMELTDPNQIGIGEDAPIHIACLEGELEDVEIMVSAGADINLIGDIGNTPLHYAVSGGNLMVVKRLIELGASPRIKNEFGETAKDIAEIKKIDEIATILKKAELVSETER
jgi:ankyrin repeat protein